MTVKILKELFDKYDIPEDVTLMSDSGWECDSTHMNCVYYNAVEECIVFTQHPYSGDYYHKKPNWELLYGEYPDYDTNCAKKMIKGEKE